MLRLVLLLPLILSLPAYSAVTSIDANTPGAVTWHVHTSGMTGGNGDFPVFPLVFDGSFTVSNGAITDWLFSSAALSAGGAGSTLLLSPQADRCVDDFVCNTAQFTSPTHALIQHLSSPYGTISLDLDFAGLTEFAPVTAQVHAYYSQLIYSGSGVIVAPEPTSLTILGMCLGMMLIKLLHGLSQGSTGRSPRPTTLAS